jgi:hypothetical protein
MYQYCGLISVWYGSVSLSVSGSCLYQTRKKNICYLKFSKISFFAERELELADVPHTSNESGHGHKGKYC